MVPFPASYKEGFHLKMMFSDDARVVAVVGIGISVDAEGEQFDFIEFFSGHPSTTDQRRQGIAGCRIRTIAVIENEWSPSRRTHSRLRT